MKKSIYLSLIFVFFFLTTSFAAEKIDQQTFRISKNFSIFNALFRELDAFYVDTLNYDKMMKTAIDEMLAELDPYTVYMPEEQTSQLTFMTTGEYAGIGALIMKMGDEICVSELYEGMPAQQNDVRVGDVILEIDGTSVKKMSLSEVSLQLRGTPSTKIELKLKRFGEKKAVIREFLREKIHVNPVAYSSIFREKTGYVLLGEFTDKSAIELRSVVNAMVKQDKIESLVIDLRNNGGGLIDEAVKIVGYFVPKGTEVVTLKGKNKLTEYTYKTPTEPLFPNVRLVIIANRSSASASEILAGSIQDLDRGIIVGERTFGKGLVQNIRPVGYDGHLKVTTAKYYIPSGRCIQAIDYSHRNEDGSVGRVPDSLTTEFMTRNGRKVRDGGGIVPDVETKNERKINITHYIYAQNQHFDFATQFVYTHPSIDKPSEFVLSEDDFNAFIDFLVERKFTYTSQTEKYFDELFEVAKLEGFDESAKEEFANLKLKLNTDIKKDIEQNKDEIIDLLSLEIIKRYYFQKGEIEFSLRSDDDLKVALDMLDNNDDYAKRLTNK